MGRAMYRMTFRVFWYYVSCVAIQVELSNLLYNFRGSKDYDSCGHEMKVEPEGFSEVHSK